jgi:hypothetical protein
MNKKTWITALTFGIPWTVFMTIYNWIINGEFTLKMAFATLVGGFVAGLLFALSMQYMAKRLFNKIKVETDENENVIKEGGANHFKGKEGVGGKLVLTNKRLIFKSHKYNIQNHQDTFELGQIERLHVTKTFKILENGLTLELSNSLKHRFIVDKPQDWVETIMNQKQTVAL